MTVYQSFIYITDHLYSIINYLYATSKLPLLQKRNIKLFQKFLSVVCKQSVQISMQNLVGMFNIPGYCSPFDYYLFLLLKKFSSRRKIRLVDHRIRWKKLIDQNGWYIILPHTWYIIQRHNMKHETFNIHLLRHSFA